MVSELHRLRRKIHRLDERLVGLVAERLRQAKRIGDVKRRLELPIRDFKVEAEVIGETHKLCRRDGVDPAVGEELMRTLIAASVDAQRSDDRPAPRRAATGSALVIGGRGRMGVWFASYLNSRGLDVLVADPRGPPRGYARAGDVARAAERADVVVVSTPMSVAAASLAAIPRTSRALIFDICSLKTPVERELRLMRRRGQRVTSLHPMWGPKAALLSDKNLAIASVGVNAADRAAAALFSDTAVRIVKMRLEDHDEMMAYVLALSHMTSLAFSRALERSGHSFAEFSHSGGPTFQKQVELSREVSAENPDLYREIQALNPRNAKVYRGLLSAIEEVREGRNSPTRFRRLMEGLDRYYGGTR